MMKQPTEVTFIEVKDRAMQLWKEVSTNDKYAIGKINKIKDLNNTGENLMYIFNMFDPINQTRFITPLSESTFIELCAFVREWETME